MADHYRPSASAMRPLKLYVRFRAARSTAWLSPDDPSTTSAARSTAPQSSQLPIAKVAPVSEYVRRRWARNRADGPLQWGWSDERI